MSFKILTLAAVASCSSGPSVDRATIGSLDYSVPSGWNHRDLSTNQRTMVEWTPTDNEDAKESVTVIRTDLPAIAKAGPGYVEGLLGQAQTSLPDGQFSSPAPFTTTHGFRGVRIEGDFVPPGQAQRYHRIHAVVISGSALLHVVYTARVADRESFEIVVDSFSNRGA